MPHKLMPEYKIAEGEISEKLQNLKKSDIVPKLEADNELSTKADQKSVKQGPLKLLEAAIDELDSSEFTDPDWKVTLHTLKDLQYEHLRIEESYRQEWCEMKLRYLEKFKPLYQRRWIALTGADNLSSVPQETPIEAIDENPSSFNYVATGTKKLPRFWLKTMRNHQALDEMIEQHDEPILEFLEDIRFKWIDPKEQTSFQLDFLFAKNSYFKNDVLSKAYYLDPSDENDEESVLTRTVGTEIQWFKGKNVTETTLVRKQRSKRTNATRVVSDVIKVNSFFNFFKTYEVPSEDQLEELTEDDISSLEMIMETEFELGAVLRDKIIPRAVGWYLGTEHDDFASENLEEFDDQDGSEESSDEQE